MDESSYVFTVGTQGMCAGNAKCLFNNGPNLVQSLTSFDIKQMAQQFLF